MKRTLIKNCRVISPECTAESLNSVYILNGKIEDIGDINAECDIVYDAGGNYLIPGLIDMNCKICEAGYENKDNLRVLSVAAAAGGYTSLTIAPNTQPIIDNKTVVDYVIQKAKNESNVNIYPYGSITKGCLGEEITEIGKMIGKGIIGISDNGAPVQNSGLLRDVLTYSRMFDIPVITNCLDKSLSDGRVINEGIISTKLGLFGSPREAEEIMVSRNIILGRYAKARLHLSNITTAFSAELIERGKKYNSELSAGTCPHYFSLTEEAAEGYNTLAKINPPLRTAADTEAIKEAIWNGTIDVIASGHTPADYDRKSVEFDLAAFGISSLETSFAVSYTCLCGENFGPDRLIEKMSTNPAKILGLKNKGIICKGYDADLAIVDFDNEYEVKGENFHSKAKYTPFEGRKVKGRVLKTFVGGKLVYDLQNNMS